MNILPVRPIPHSGESLQGYMLRVVRDNGWTSIAQVLSATKRQRTIKLHTDNSALINTVYSWTGHSAVLSDGQFLPSPARVYRPRSDIPYRYLEVDSPRVCAGCLAEGRHLQVQWNFLPYTHCLRHSQKLLGACPGCRTPFKWDVGLLGKGCPKCSLSWKSMAVATTPLPTYLTEFLSLSESKQVDYISDLSVACHRAIRPYDEVLDRRKRLPAEIKDWEVVLKTAYGMLSDVGFIRRWRDSCRYARQKVKLLGERALLSPLTSVAERLAGAWPLTDVLAEPTGTTTPMMFLKALPVVPARAQKMPAGRRTTDELCSFYCDIKGVAAALGIPVASAWRLAERGILRTVNDTRATNGSHFDLREIAERFKGKSAPSKSDELRPLASLDRMLSLYGIDWADVMEAILYGRVAGILMQTGESFTEKLWVHPVILSQFIRERFSEVAADETVAFPRSIVKEMLKLTTTDLAQLAVDGILYEYTRRQGYFRACDVARFLDEYWVLPRWTEEHRVDEQLIRQRLERSGFRSVSGRHTYRLTEDLAKTLG